MREGDEDMVLVRVEKEEDRMEMENDGAAADGGSIMRLFRWCSQEEWTMGYYRVERVLVNGVLQPTATHQWSLGL